MTARYDWRGIHMRLIRARAKARLEKRTLGAVTTETAQALFEALAHAQAMIVLDDLREKSAASPVTR